MLEFLKFIVKKLSCFFGSCFLIIIFIAAIYFPLKFGSDDLLAYFTNLEINSIEDFLKTSSKLLVGSVVGVIYLAFLGALLFGIVIISKMLFVEWGVRDE